MSPESNTSKLQTARRPPRRAGYNRPLHPSICGPCLSSSPVSPWNPIHVSGHVDLGARGPRKGGALSAQGRHTPPFQTCHPCSTPEPGGRGIGGTWPL